jgi:Flp pilus assembly pilin Flp
MAMLKNFVDFAGNEDGAVTVDWVVLTAAIVGLSLAMIATLSPAISGTATGIAAQITAANPTP